MIQLKILLTCLGSFIIISTNRPSGVTQQIINPDIEYSATCYIHAINPGGNSSYKNVLHINHAPNTTRFANLNKKYDPVVIFRYDKDIIWLIHPELKQYEGVKLFQEFELKNGMGVNSHIDQIMRAQSELKSMDKLTNLGKEIIDGITCTHYQMKEPYPFQENAFTISDYWVSEKGLLIKKQYSGPDFSGTLETKDIKFGKQAEHFFIPPPDYKKAGDIIKWKEEKEKLDAAKNKN